MFYSRVAPAARANLRISDRLRELHALFSAFDADHSGELSLREFGAGVRPLVGALEPDEERFLFAAFDFGRRGAVNLAEFDFALFGGLQAAGAAGDAAGVRAVVADAVARRLAEFRALAPGAHGNRGSRVDDNAVEVRQEAAQARQRRGQGAAAAAARVLCSASGVGSAAGLAAVAAGVALGLVSGARFFALAAAGYVLHACASCASADAGAVFNVVAGADALAAAFEGAFRANASYRWHIECYHYETRVRHGKDSKGHSTTHTERVRVTTHTATREGRLRTFDASPPFAPAAASALSQLSSRAVVRVRFDGYFAARDAWRAANARDQHQDFSASEGVAEVRPELLVEFVPGARPWWVSAPAFALATLALGALCYRVAFDARCGHLEYTFLKDAVGFSEDAVSEEARALDAEQAWAQAQAQGAAAAAAMPVSPPQPLAALTAPPRVP